MSFLSKLGRARHVSPVNSDTSLDLNGDYRSWADAAAASDGYESATILEKTRLALLQVKHGERAFERDSVTFEVIEYNWPLVASFMWSAATNNGHLNVLDFGGSLGSTYFQNRGLISPLPSVRWNVVEQKNHVDVGRKWFQDGTLRFFTSIDECVLESRPNVALVGGVLQYLEDPYSVVTKLMESSIDTLVFDRTPFWNGAVDRLCVQTVPPSIYEASYPSWIFSKAGFLSRIPDEWQVLTIFDCPDRLSGPVQFAYEGVIIVRKATISERRLRSPLSSGLDQP